MATRTIRKIDLSKVSGSFEAMPNGRYRVTIEKREFSDITEGKNAGETLLRLTFNIDPEMHPDMRGRKIFDSIALVENQYWRLRQLGDALGMDEAEIAEFDADEGLQGYIEAQTALVLETIQRTQGDKVYTNVKTYYQDGEADPVGPYEPEEEEAGEIAEVPTRPF